MIKDLGFELEKYENAIGIIAECTDDYLFIYNLTSDYYSISAGALKTFALEQNDFDNATQVLRQVVYPDDWGMLLEDVSALKDGRKDTHDLEYRWLDKKGNPVWISCRGKIITNADERYLIGRIAEIGIGGKYDNVTGLHSELFFLQKYQELTNQDCDYSGYALLIGIDNLRKINEKHGMDIGNQILAKLSRCIKNNVYAVSKCSLDGVRHCVYRLKGDEFIICEYIARVKGQPVLVSQSELVERARNIYKQIRVSVDEEIEANDYKLFYTISGGTAAFDSCKDEIEGFLKNLRFALHKAKLNGKNRLEVYDEAEYLDTIRRMDMQEELRSDIIHGCKGFELYYQPIMNATHNVIYGSEALIRWNSKKYGFMSPDKFVPLLEESSLIIPLGRWIIREAVKQCVEWLEYCPDFVMNINLSYVQILKSDIFKDTMEIVDSYGIDHSHIVFEVTESGNLSKNKAVRNVLAEFANKSFSLAIDDFGTGYSNFSYIRNMMFSIIKIDRAFIANINRSTEDYLLVKYISEMAHNLNLRVCVEGVETEQELSKVKTLAPDCIQGYYYGKPVCAEQFKKDMLEI